MADDNLREAWEALVGRPRGRQPGPNRTTEERQAAQVARQQRNAAWHARLDAWKTQRRQDAEAWEARQRQRDERRAARERKRAEQQQRNAEVAAQATARRAAHLVERFISGDRAARQELLADPVLLSIARAYGEACFGVTPPWLIRQGMEHERDDGDEQDRD